MNGEHPKPDARTPETVFDKISERCTGMERPDHFPPPAKMALQEIETGRSEPLGFATRTEYDLSFRLTCTYWANRAQHQDARKNAERVLADLLYRDVLVDLSLITHAVYDGEQTTALRMLAALQTRLRR